MKKTVKLIKILMPVLTKKPKIRNTKNTSPLETFEQESLVNYLDLLKLQGHKVKYTAIPNSTFVPNSRAKFKILAKNKKQGLHGGLPDLFIIINNHPLFIEMKRQKGGLVTENQIEWITTINQAGIPAFVCKGFSEAKAIINQIISQ